MIEESCYTVLDVRASITAKSIDKPKSIRTVEIIVRLFIHI